MNGEDWYQELVAELDRMQAAESKDGGDQIKQECLTETLGTQIIAKRKQLDRKMLKRFRFDVRNNQAQGLFKFATE
jgi:hypothetical protein